MSFTVKLTLQPDNQVLIENHSATVVELVPFAGRAKIILGAKNQAFARAIITKSGLSLCNAIRKPQSW